MSSQLSLSKSETSSGTWGLSRTSCCVTRVRFEGFWFSGVVVILSGPDSLPAPLTSSDTFLLIILEDVNKFW